MEGFLSNVKYFEYQTTLTSYSNTVLTSNHISEISIKSKSKSPKAKPIKQCSDHLKRTVQ